MTLIHRPNHMLEARRLLKLHKMQIYFSASDKGGQIICTYTILGPTLDTILPLIILWSKWLLFCSAQKKPIEDYEH